VRIDRQALGKGDDVGRQPEFLGPEHGPGPAEAGDDLVGDEQDVVTGEDLLDAVVVVRRRDDDPACPQDRLPDECGDGVGALGGDDRLETSDELIGEFCRVIGGPGIGAGNLDECR
jgi:hypothetical protein